MYTKLKSRIYKQGLVAGKIAILVNVNFNELFIPSNYHLLHRLQHPAFCEPVVFYHQAVIARLNASGF